MSKLFLTGASGYIGGQVLRELARSRPELSITILVRDPQKAKHILDSFPRVRTVIEDLDNTEVLEREASQASVILHLAATNHLKSVQAIHKGLRLREPVEPAYWIQVSGASALAAGELSSPDFIPGSPSSQVFDDLSGLSHIHSVIRAHPSRAVDNYLLDVAAEGSHIKTALVFPPIIYGQGEGPVNRRSIQIPELSRVTLARGHGVRVGQGANRWGNVHVRDVGKLFLALAEAATSQNSHEMLWGEAGVYLAGVGEITFGDISARVAGTARSQGFIQSDQVEELDKSTSDQVLPHGSVLFGTNARSNARRASEVLGWEPKEESLEVEIPRAVAEEAQRRKHEDGKATH